MTQEHPRPEIHKEPKERTFFSRITDGISAAVTAIPRAILWTAGFFGLSYLAGEVDEKADLIGVRKAFKGTEKEKKEAREKLTDRAMISVGASMGISGLLKATITPATAVSGADPKIQANLPRNTTAQAAQVEN